MVRSKISTTINIELDRIFGLGVAQLAIEFQGSNPDDINDATESNEDTEESADGSELSDTSGDELDASLGRKTSNPTRQGSKRGRKINERSVGSSTASLSPIREPFGKSNFERNQDKKIKLDRGEGVSQASDGQMDKSSGNLQGGMVRSLLRWACRLGRSVSVGIGWLSSRGMRVH